MIFFRLVGNAEAPLIGERNHQKLESTFFVLAATEYNSELGIMYTR